MFDEFKKVTIDYNRFEDIKLSEENQLFLEVIVDGVPFEFLVNIKEKSDKMIVFGSGAYDSKKMKPPIFNRYSWADKFDCTTIFYNDPTLYLGKINLGWGYGNDKQHYLGIIADIIKRIQNELSISNQDILFYGSSGGGFKSLMLAGLIQGSKAFANNPQTIITNYYKTHVTNLHQVVYRDDLNNKFVKERTNIIEFYKSLNYVPEIYYAQNVADKHDVNNHLIPFIQGLNQLDDRIINNKITMHYYSDKEQGHNPLDAQTTISLIKKFISNNSTFIS